MSHGQTYLQVLHELKKTQQRFQGQYRILLVCSSMRQFVSDSLVLACHSLLYAVPLFLLYVFLSYLAVQLCLLHRFGTYVSFVFRLHQVTKPRCNLQRGRQFNCCVSAFDTIIMRLTTTSATRRPCTMQIFPPPGGQGRER